MNKEYYCNQDAVSMIILTNKSSHAKDAEVLVLSFDEYQAETLI